MAFEQPPLPFAKDALEPYGMKAETFEYHYGKHHKAYVDNLNKLTEGSDLANKSLEEVIKISFQDSSKAGIFNNAAQVWNHSFFWKLMNDSSDRRHCSGSQANTSKHFLPNPPARPGYFLLQLLY